MSEIVVKNVRETTNHRYFYLDLNYKQMDIEVSVSVHIEDTPDIWEIDNIEFLTENTLTSEEKEEIEDWIYENTEAWYEQIKLLNLNKLNWRIRKWEIQH